MISWAVHRYPGIYLTAEENSGKPQLGDHLMKALPLAIASNGVPYYEMKRIAQHIRKGKGKKEGKDRAEPVGSFLKNHFSLLTSLFSRSVYFK